jgi:hypothetical protein
MNRLYQVILIASFLGFSWLAMQAVHELGHVLGAAATGGTVTKVVLHPATISRTDVAPNPRPLAVVWAGPIVGVLAPLAAWLATRALRLPGVFLFRSFAGFCLIANGAYIGAGTATAAADAGDMLRHGAAHGQLILFAVLATSLGLYLWHGQGRHFGLVPVQRASGTAGDTAPGDSASGEVSRAAAVASLLLFTLVFAVEWIFGGR